MVTKILSFRRNDLEGQRVEPLAVVALIFLCFLGGRVLWDRLGRPPIVVVQWQPSVANAAAGDASPEQASGGALQEISLEAQTDDLDMVIAPYDHYELTQGLHGFSYGHMAIDLSAGDGAPIKAPIGGVVTGLFVDNLGNTTLILENEHYRVTMLHGIYSVVFGEMVELGQQIGVESNQGNTYDALGRSCRGRDCGYHTHLNIYDKQLGANVDPLGLIE
jgi:murein DD-endopeptidase MepM/ murein hydrolase activator NlpD